MTDQRRDAEIKRLKALREKAKEEVKDYTKRINNLVRVKCRA